MASFLAHIHAGDGPEGQRVLTSALRGVQDWRGASGCFEEALLSVVVSTAVVDQIAFAEAAVRAIPREATALGARSRSMMAAVHLAIAIDSVRSGWAAVGLEHLRLAVRAAPRVLCSRDAWLVVRHGVALTAERHNRRLVAELRRVSAAFERAGITTWLVGTLAVSLHARTFVKTHDDIDLVTDDPDDFARALTLLTGPLAYRLVSDHAWIAYCGRQARLTALRSPGGAAIELAYLPHWRDSGHPPLAVPHGPLRARQRVMMDGVPVWTMHLADLRHLYAVFLVENAADNAGPKRQNDKNAILAIDRVIATAAHSHGSTGADAHVDA